MTLESQNRPNRPAQDTLSALADPLLRLLKRALQYIQIAWNSLRRAFFAESDRWFLWSPVLVGTGVGIYFSLPIEPPLWAALLLPLVALAFHRVLRRFEGRGAATALSITAIIALCMSLGLAAATLRTALMAAPVLQTTWSGELTGQLISAEVSQSGGLTVVIAPNKMERLADDATPARVRLSIRQKGVEITPGETLRLRARLLPPPDPVEPGGFDFARQVWFQRIGGVGFAYSAPELIAPSPDDATTRLARLRSTITTRVRDTIGGPAGAVAAALITGEKRAIPQKAVEDLRKAGLAHVLSISGLHMVLFAGSLFWLLRAGLAMSSRLALNYPIKKWSAAVALCGATFYLLISGAGIPTQRAWVMISLMFVAILADRPAISLRNVALAALIILIWQPESLLSAGFHMSFAAVVALISFYETPTVQRLREPSKIKDALPLVGAIRSAGRHMLGIALTTIVAGFATGAYSAFHFNHLEPYSLIGNLGALPLVSFVVMPAALIALILMPFGLDAPALWVMGQGIDVMLGVAQFVSELEGSEGVVADAPMPALMAVTFGGLWLALWKGRWRWGGVAPIALGLLLWTSGQQPDILIDRDGRLVALRSRDGQLQLSASRPAYAAKTWLRHDGDARTPKEAAKSDFKFCDATGCVWREKGSPIVALPSSLAAMSDDCAQADIIVADFGLPYRLKRACKAYVIDRFDLWRNGATSITFSTELGNVSTRQNWKIDTARASRGNRPWVREPYRRPTKKVENTGKASASASASGQ